MSLVTETDISRSAQAVWKSVFGHSLPSAPLQRTTSVDERFLVAKVNISGDPSRSIVVVCPQEEARRLAALFFQVDVSTVKEPLIHDVFGELANMIGGLIKRHFPHSARLSLPEVKEAPFQDARQKTVAQAFFECGSKPIAVRLVQNPS
jgi:hypothetical protein